MNEINRSTVRTGAKRIGMTLGVGAAFALGVLGIGHSAPEGTSSLAGSGDAPANTTYSQPVVAGMNVGATATWTTPATVEPTAKAVPALGGTLMTTTRRIVMWGAAAIAAAALGTAVPAHAAAPPSVTGKKYSDASATLSGAGFTPVVSTTVGDQMKWPDCLVTNETAQTIPPPPNSAGSATNEVLVSLNCYATNATATSAGYSAASPEGREIAAEKAAEKAKEAAAEKAAQAKSGA